MKVKEIEETMQDCRNHPLHEIKKHLSYWVRSIDGWIDKYRLGIEYKLSKLFLNNCQKWAIDSAIMAEIMRRELLFRRQGEYEAMNPSEVQKISRKFIDNLVETCLSGGGRVVIEEYEHRRRLIIELCDFEAGKDCIYKSDRPQLIQCAVNPKGDCSNCQFKEVR